MIPDHSNNALFQRISSKIIAVALLLCLLLAGCASNTHRIIVKDGECQPLENAKIYYTREGILTFAPLVIFTNPKGIAILPSDTDTMNITKEAYKPVYFEVFPPDPVIIYMYNETEEYESGLIDFKKCKE